MSLLNKTELRNNTILALFNIFGLDDVIYKCLSLRDFNNIRIAFGKRDKLDVDNIAKLADVNIYIQHIIDTTFMTTHAHIIHLITSITIDIEFMCYFEMTRKKIDWISKLPNLCRLIIRDNSRPFTVDEQYKRYMSCWISHFNMLDLIKWTAGTLTKLVFAFDMTNYLNLDIFHKSHHWKLPIAINTVIFNGNDVPFTEAVGVTHLECHNCKYVNQYPSLNTIICKTINLDKIDNNIREQLQYIHIKNRYSLYNGRWNHNYMSKMPKYSSLQTIEIEDDVNCHITIGCMKKAKENGRFPKLEWLTVGKYNTIKMN